eukprot:TRINITY_DN10447_c0_g1_i1.p1 TRINITY_DN10447_c0_g1~~TRINITY_DN10447_c0_g1_i1.p1  ORF type:complete len:105 (-),score=22.11 TRINITY_DN10447_c0_g1_i1:70-384(-)
MERFLPSKKRQSEDEILDLEKRVHRCSNTNNKKRKKVSEEEVIEPFQDTSFSICSSCCACNEYVSNGKGDCSDCGCGLLYHLGDCDDMWDYDDPDTYAIDDEYY